MTEDQVRELIREQILLSFEKNVRKKSAEDKVDVMSEADLRMLARSKIREASLKKKVLK